MYNFTVSFIAALSVFGIGVMTVAAYQIWGVNILLGYGFLGTMIGIILYYL